MFILGIIFSFYYLPIIANIFGIFVSDLSFMCNLEKGYKSGVEKWSNWSDRGGGVDLKKTKIPPPPKFIESEKTWSLPKFS